MSVYFIVSYDIDDPEGFASYPPGVVPLLEKHNAETLVVDANAKVLEGESRDINVILKFESEEAAMNFYNDPDYAPLKQIRLSTTKNGSGVLAKEFVIPTEA